jgi:hypothetical protein
LEPLIVNFSKLPEGGSSGGGESSTQPQPSSSVDGKKEFSGIT